MGYGAHPMRHAVSNGPREAPCPEAGAEASLGASSDGGDAIVVLGCRVLPSGRLSAEATARTEAAAAAYLAGKGRVVVASGGRRWGPHAEATRMKAALVEAGVPPEAIVAELCSLSTFENAVFVAALLGRLGVRRAHVVTSDFHLRRALENFRALGVTATGLPSRVPRRSLARRAVLFVHERLSARLDRARHLQREMLCESAAQLAGGHA
jgi:uncharacterized SAM-binding protein YcdF (DUF218 family)